MSERESGGHLPTGARRAGEDHPGVRLKASKERILSLWEQRLCKEVPAAASLPHPILINTVPALLDQLAEAFSPEHGRRIATEGSTNAHEHGGERVRLTEFRLEDLMAEYRILRQVLFEVLEETAPLSRDERHTLDTSVDQALLEACTTYALVQSRFRDQFFALVAHDLRTPLNAAQSAAALISREPQGKNVARWARVISENIARVDHMVKDLLDAMRVQAGARLLLDIKSCDLAAIVRQTVARFEAQHGDRLVLNVPETMPAHVAPDSVSRALENLVTNAVKYGAPARPITIALSDTHGRAILSVHNEGPHIPAERQETLFRAFQRSSAAEASGKVGWGLGLAQVRAVAEAHGGSIGVDSLPGCGATFTIDIPLDARPYQQRPVTPAQ
jgi:signal transduction histidine kinase